MSFVERDALGTAPLPPAQVCIAGAGAAGIALACELDAAGIDVLLIESGGLKLDERVQALYDLDSTGYPLRDSYMSRARYFGGSCRLWAGRSMVLNPIDFQSRDWVPESGWPIPYEELTRYYAEAGRVLELPGLDAAAFERYRRQFSGAETRLFASGSGLVPTVSVWAKSTQRFDGDYRRRLARSRNVRVLLNHSIAHVELDESGTRVTGLVARSLDGSTVPIRATEYVLACGGLENARVLLASRDRQPAGIGNEHDQVGRCFMDHPRAVYGKVHVPETVRLRALRGRPLPDGKLQIGIALDEATQRRERLLNHYVTLELQTSGYAEARYQAMVQTAKVLLRRGHAGSRWDLKSMRMRDLPNMVYLLSPKELMPHFAYRAFVTARELVPRKPTPQTYIVVYFCEQPPDADSRVTLSGERDALGVPRLSLDWRIRADVDDSIRRMQGVLAERIAAAGLGRLEPGDGEIRYTDASHHMGTTRMSADARHGVVDADCRVHGVANLFMAGSSVFPSAGHANPTLSLVALALRLGRHLRDRLAR
jgi:choline dehydrogenase-like flavoprotein